MFLYELAVAEDARRQGIGLALTASLADLARSQGCYGMWVGVDTDNAAAHATFAAVRRGGARFSITARMNPTVVKAISGIKESAWTPIHYPNAIWDEDEQRLVSDAEVAEVAFTAFTSRRHSDHISARLIVRRVRRLNPKSVPEGQGELFPDYRHHGVFTDSPLTMLDAEKSHRAHAIVEQVIADLKASALVHLPSGSFCSQQRLAGLGRDRIQPHPRRRDHRLGLPRQSHHRDHPPAVDRRPRSPRQVRQASGHPPTQPLALAGQLGRALQHSLRPTNPSNDLTNQPRQGPTQHPVEEPDSPGPLHAPPRTPT